MATINGKMTPSMEVMSLYVHGTRPAEISPANIVQAAEQDIRAKAFNAKLIAQRKDLVAFPMGSFARKNMDRSRPYGFVKKHIMNAKDARDLIKIAIEDNGPGVTSPNRNTLMLYDDKERLKAALALIEQAETVES